MVDDDFIYILCEFCKSRQLSDSKNTFTEDCISKMVLVNKLCREQLQNSQWSSQNGGPFEFNLRDLFRWVEGAEKVNLTTILNMYSIQYIIPLSLAGILDSVLIWSI